MRFVAQHSGLVVQIRRAQRRLLLGGEEITTVPEIVARFRPEFNQHDLEVALQSFQFRGAFQHEDEATPVHPAHRLSVYDTDEEYERSQQEEAPWDGDTKALVEQRLLQAGSYGRSFVVVPEMEMDPPWPKYPLEPDVDATDLVMTVHTVIGIPFEEVLAYEESKWGPQREDVIQALQNAIAVRDEDKVIVE